MDKNYLAKSVCVAKVTYRGIPRDCGFNNSHSAAAFQDPWDTFPSIMMQKKYLI